jgi:phosphonate transport system permease protein
MTTPALARAPSRPRAPAWIALGLAAATIAAIGALDWDWSFLSSAENRAQAWGRVSAFFSAFGAPDLSAEALEQGLTLALQTLSTALCGTLIGLVLGYVVALGASRAVIYGTGSHPRSPARRVLLEASRLLLDVLRGVPDFAWAILILTGPGPGPVTGMLAIGLSVAGILGKIFSELWDSVPRRSYEAIAGGGGGRLETFLYGIQPLASRSMLSYTLMRTECAIRNASVIGIVGGGGLGAQLFDEFNYGNHGRVVTLLLFVLALTASADLCSNFLRYHLRSDVNHPRTPRGLDLLSALRRRAFALGVVLALAAACAWYLRDAFARAGAELSRIEWSWIRVEFGKLLVPDLGWRAVSEAFVSSRVPLALGLIGTLLGVAIAAACAYPGSVAFQLDASRFSGERASALVRLARAMALLTTRAFALVLRSVPEVGWLLVLAACFKIGALAAIGAVALHSGGVLARVFVESIDNVPYRRLERAHLGSRPATFLYAGVSRCAREWRTYSLFQFESNVRAGVVLGIVGVGGLGDVFHSSFVHWSLHRASTFLLMMVLLTAAIDRMSRSSGLARVAR